MAGQAGHRPAGGVDVALDLDQGDRALGRSPVGVTDRVAGVLPALVEQARASSAGGIRRSRRRRGRPTRRSRRAPPGRSARAARAARRRPSRRGSRRAGSATAASRRCCRSRRRAGVSPQRAISPLRSSWRILPGSASCHGSSVVACRRASTVSVVDRQRRDERHGLERGDDAVAPEQRREPRDPGGEVPLAVGRPVVAQQGEVGQRLAPASGRAARDRSRCGRPRADGRRPTPSTARRGSCRRPRRSTAVGDRPADRQSLVRLELRLPASRSTLAPGQPSRSATGSSRPPSMTTVVVRRTWSSPSYPNDDPRRRRARSAGACRDPVRG